MPGTTATQNLAYPVGTDLLKDQGKYTRDLAVAVDSRLRAHDLDVARSQIPPFVLAERTTEKTNDLAFGGQRVLFDFETVLEDTAGLMSLEDDPRVIQLNRLGWWNIGAYVKLAQTGCAPGFATLYISTDFDGDFGQPLHDAIVGFVAGSSEALIRVTDSSAGLPKVTASVSLSGSNCASTYTMQFARMWAYWVRDL